MTEMAAHLLADAAALDIAYWGALIVGGGLLLVSIIGGSHADAGVDAHTGVDFDADVHMADLDLDADFDVDADFDIDGAADFDVDVGTDIDTDIAHASHAAGGGAAALATWFSMRFVVFFLAVFGAVGVILTHLTAVGRTATLVVALVAGVAVGQAVHQMFRTIRRTSGDSTPSPRDYVNKLARVTIAIHHPRKGEVALHVRGTRRNVPAVADDARASFAAGEEVVVVGYRAGVARVVSRAQFEQRMHSVEGDTK